MKVKIYFANDQDKEKIGFSIKHLIKKAVTETLKSEHFDHKTELSVSFVDNEEIHKMNLEHRGKDKPTDVLSFPMWEKEEILDGSCDDGHAVTLGDIVLSVEKAKAQSEEYGHSLQRELAFLSVHSTLHLLGYDHEVSKEDEIYMNEKQEEILNKIGQPRG